MQLLHLPPKFIFWNCRETRSHFESRPKIVNIHGYFELREPIRTRENYYPLIWWILNPDIHSFKGILFPGSWTPESGNFFFYGIRNPELWNSEYSSMNPDPISDWNPESNFHWQNPVHVYFESGTSGVGIQNRDCLDSLIGTSYVPKHNVTTIL